MRSFAQPWVLSLFSLSCFFKKSDTHPLHWIIHKTQCSDCLATPMLNEWNEAHINIWCTTTLNQVLVNPGQYHLLPLLSPSARNWIGDLLHAKCVFCHCSSPQLLLLLISKNNNGAHFWRKLPFPFCSLVGWHHQHTEVRQSNLLVLFASWSLPAFT